MRLCNQPTGRASLGGSFSLLALLAVLALSGCATRQESAASGSATEKPSACAAFAEQRKTLRYQTAYRLSAPDTASADRNFKSLPNNESVRARHYTLRFDRDRTGPCNHLTMHKELYLQRRDKSGYQFQEMREFFSGDGTLIAVKNETLANQLLATGYYVAAVPLPIPATAPAGAYRVVTKLIATNGKGRPEILASASANFQVAANARQ